jgi:Zn-dependent peptidase ImmA (M78 family)/transcriptional regulator with XRE-family HTH domain
MHFSALEQIDPKILGPRLQDARRSCGFTQQAVAEELDVARTTLVAIEKGERRLTPHELIALAKLYGRPVSEFVGRQVVAEGLVPQFRAAWLREFEADSALAGVAGELQRLAEDYVELERLCEMPLGKSYPLPYETSGTSPEQAAESVATAERNRLGLGDGPISNLRDALESDVGLRIFYFPLPSKVAGVFAYNDTLGGCIGVNASHPRDRQQWSLAHEYGHFLTSRYQPEITFLLDQSKTAARERLADGFARNFLMPGGSLNRRFTEIHRTSERRVTLAHICSLADLYCVSVQALILRLEELKRLPAGTWDRLQIEGFKVRTAQKLLGIEAKSPDKDWLPKRYVNLAVLAYQQDKLSEGQLARILRTDRVSARALVEEVSRRLHAENDGDFPSLQLDLMQPLGGR